MKRRPLITCERCGKRGRHGIETHIKFCRMGLAERFWPKVDKRGEHECWPWMGSRKPMGYGHLIMHRKNWNAHRLSYELANGPIPEGMHVLHKCDNPPCVNPTHLFLGTHTDNMRDKQRKGREHRNKVNGRWAPNASSSVATEGNERG